MKISQQQMIDLNEVKLTGVFYVDETYTKKTRAYAA